MLVIYKNAGEWVCQEIHSSSRDSGFRKATVNSTPVYVTESIAVIPSPVLRPQVVGKVDAPEYRLAIGTAKRIVLVPQDAIILNRAGMKKISDRAFIKPGDDVISALNRKNNVPAVEIAINEKKAGFELTGPAIDQIRIVCGMDKNASFSTADAMNALTLCGVDKVTAKRALSETVKHASAGTGPVRIWGVKDTVFNTDDTVRREKIANIRGTVEEYCASIRKCMVKEASLIQDPAAVDTVLSLNFINAENIKTYISSLPVIEKVESDLCAMLVSSRMGMRQIDEASTKSAIENLDKVKNGLIALKTSIGK
jgi:hypothetical protein